MKELRKNLFVKAHPVPNFYYEGPPPKVEPKKVNLYVIEHSSFKQINNILSISLFCMYVMIVWI